MTFCRRRSLTATWKSELPLEQSAPWLMGCLGSPSILTTLPFLVWTSRPHPTAQNGQIVVLALIPLMRVSGASALASPGVPLRATPAAASAPPCKNCLRDIPILKHLLSLSTTCQNAILIKESAVYIKCRANTVYGIVDCSNAPVYGKYQEYAQAAVCQTRSRFFCGLRKSVQ